MQCFGLYICFVAQAATKSQGGESSTPFLIPCKHPFQHSHQEYLDVLQVSEATAAMPWTQTMETVTRVVASYWACLLFHRRMFDTGGPPNAFHRAVVTKVTNLLHVLYEHERNNGRAVWCTFMAAIEVDDAVRRSWLLERLRETSALSTECGWAFATAEEILRVQSALETQTPWVDLAAYMQQSQDGCTA